jgi:ABC-type branched-subunit amino acid transport system ATPase component/ABC-type branched-subunit amino acid transport system permease subunit
LLSLLRQPLNALGAVVAVGWVFFAPDYRVFTVTTGLIIGVLALGLMVMVGWAREINLAAAGVYATSLYLGSWVYRPGPNGWGDPLLVAIAVSIGVGIVMMLAVAVFSVRLSGVYVMVFTLGVQILVERIVFTHYRLTGGDQGLVTPSPKIFGWEISSANDRTFYLFVLGVTVLVLAFLRRLRLSPHGRAILLVGADQQAAVAVGVRPLRIKALAFAVCGALGGLAGILAATLYGSTPGTVNYTATTSLLWLSIAVLGGFDSMTGVLLVAVAFQYIPFQLEKLHVNYQLLAGISLMAGVLCGSRGLGGRLHDLYRRARFGPAVRRRSSGRASFPAAAEVLARADGLRELPELGPSAEVRRQSLETLERWFPPRRTDPVALEVTDVHVAFGGVRALRGASISVPTGSFTGLIGPNGAGKTTLFDVVSGLTRADRGAVRIFGDDVTSDQPWERAARGMTRTFQTTRIVRELSVADNLLAGTGLRISGSLPQFLVGSRPQWRQVREAEEAAWAIACLLDIERYWDERVGEVEFSARRPTELGRALLSGPQILLLDEPTSGLDPASSGALIGLVRRLQADLGLTVLLVEHYVKAVLDGCDLVYVLAEGSILAAGDPGAVAADPAVQDRYLGASRGAATVPWRERLASTPEVVRNG